MIPYHQISQDQKNIFLDLLNGIFEFYVPQGHTHYRIGEKGCGIIIRESTMQPPIQESREKFQRVLSELKKKLIEYSSHEVFVSSKLKLFPEKASCIIVERVNAKLIGQLSNISCDKVPIQIPEQIQENMDNFSTELQAYIKQCHENLKTELGQNPAIKLIKRSSPSPIELTRRLKIPVKLPSSNLSFSEEHYDLVKLLNLPTHSGKKWDRVKGHLFGLDQIIPAPELLVQGKKLDVRNQVSLAFN